MRGFYRAFPSGHRSLGEKAALNLEKKIELTLGVLVNPYGHGPALIEGEYTRQEDLGSQTWCFLRA